jgi:hypothetical protein
MHVNFKNLSGAVLLSWKNHFIRVAHLQDLSFNMPALYDALACVLNQIIMKSSGKSIVYYF